MSKITSKVAMAVQRALDEYGDPIIIVDRNGTEYYTDAIARRPVFLVTEDATLSEYYFLIATGEFDRIRTAIGKDTTPPPFFGNERVIYEGETYILRQSEPFEYYDGTRQVIRLWGTKKK